MKERTRKRSMVMIQYICVYINIQNTHISQISKRLTDIIVVTETRRGNKSVSDELRRDLHVFEKSNHPIKY